MLVFEHYADHCHVVLGGSAYATVCTCASVHLCEFEHMTGRHPIVIKRLFYKVVDQHAHVNIMLIIVLFF